MSRQYQQGDILLGNWKLVKLLGQGSYGKVYEAHREDFGITYKAAIKIISVPGNESEILNARAEGLDDASITAYFRSVVEDIVSEFGLMSRLKGTANIVSYEDHAVIPHRDGIGWDILIRMELLTPMLDYMSRHKMTRQDIIQLGMDMCRALELCQKYNIIHRDIKPENMFVSDAGDYKLGDFGVARTLEKTTGGLSKKGTYTYMAPEVYREEPYGSTVDIYSLGIVMYRLLNNNRAPFLPQPPAGISHGDRERALVRRISGEALPKPANAEGRLAEIVLKACAYNPKDRYGSPMQMRQELKTIAYNKAEDRIVNRGQEPIRVSKTAFDTGSAEKAEDKTLDQRTKEKQAANEKKAAQPSKEPEEEKPIRPQRTPKEKKTAKRPPEEKNGKKKMGIAAAILGAAVILWGLLFFALREKPVKQETDTQLRQESTETAEPTEMQTAPAPAETEEAVTLPAEPEDTRWERNILKSASGGSWEEKVYDSEIPKYKVVAVTFLDTLSGAPTSSWDVSEAGDGSVLAWFSGFNDKYELFIAGEGGVNGVNACYWMFSYYTSLEQINFNNSFHTEQTTNMNSMFYGCVSLTALDISSLNTGNVTDMDRMFGRCEKLQELDLRSLDTAKVTDMGGMFSFCSSLTRLDVSTWDTAKVEDMSWMFYHCLKLEELDLSNFETGSLKDLYRMFSGCTVLKNVDLSSFDTSSVTDMSEMFYECPVLADMDLSHFDTSNAASHNNFMNQNKKVNGKPWAELFQKKNRPYADLQTDEEGFVIVDNSAASSDTLCVLGYRVSDGKEINNPQCRITGDYTQLTFSWKETSEVTTTLISDWDSSDYSEAEMKSVGSQMLSVWKANGMSALSVPETNSYNSFPFVPEDTCYVLLLNLDKDMNIASYTVLKLGYPE